MNWKKSVKQDANALTVKNFCKNVLKENRDIMTHCCAVSDNKGHIISLKVIMKYSIDNKIEFTFKSLSDIRENLEELSLLNYKIQDLCKSMRESIKSY